MEGGAKWSVVISDASWLRTSELRQDADPLGQEKGNRRQERDGWGESSEEGQEPRIRAENQRKEDRNAEKYVGIKESKELGECIEE